MRCSLSYALVLTSFIITGCDVYGYGRYNEFTEVRKTEFIQAEQNCRKAVNLVFGSRSISKKRWMSGGDPKNNSIGVSFESRKKRDGRFYFCEVYPDGEVFRLTYGNENEGGKNQISFLEEYQNKIK